MSGICHCRFEKPEYETESTGKEEITVAEFLATGEICNGSLIWPPLGVKQRTFDSSDALKRETYFLRPLYPI